MKYCYAVRAGRKTGVFYDYNEARSQIVGYKGADWKGFDDAIHAQRYVNEYSARPKEADILADLEKAIEKEQEKLDDALDELEYAQEKVDVRARWLEEAEDRKEYCQIAAPDRLVYEYNEFDEDIKDYAFRLGEAEDERDYYKNEVAKARAALDVLTAKLKARDFNAQMFKLLTDMKDMTIKYQAVSDAQRGVKFYTYKGAIFDNLKAIQFHFESPYPFEPYNSLNEAIAAASKSGYKQPHKYLREELSYMTKKGKEIHQVFVDGACSRNGQPGAIAGIGVYFGPHNPMNVAEPYTDHTGETNQRAELAAIKKAYELIADNGRGRLYDILSDSQYAIDCLTKWCFKWQKNGWKNSRGHTVANMDLIQDILRLMKFPVCSTAVLKKVQAHSDSVGNQMADRMAVEGMNGFFGVYSATWGGR